jgi:hypothetical protein
MKEQMEDREAKSDSSSQFEKFSKGKAWRKVIGS